MRILFLCGLTMLSLGLSACATSPDGKPNENIERTFPKLEQDRQREKFGTLSGDEKGLTIFGGEKGKQAGGGGAAGIGVNVYLWRASLDTLSFMPLAAADPFGGVINTDWYAPKGAERYKVTVLILDTELRSDALKVSVFTQKQQGGSWRDVPTNATTARQLENTILQRARQLRLQEN
jgi:hypothetical protein